MRRDIYHTVTCHEPVLFIIPGVHLILRCLTMSRFFQNIWWIIPFRRLEVPAFPHSRICLICFYHSLPSFVSLAIKRAQREPFLACSSGHGLCMYIGYRNHQEKVRCTSRHLRSFVTLWICNLLYDITDIQKSTLSFQAVFPCKSLKNWTH